MSRRTILVGSAAAAALLIGLTGCSAGGDGGGEKLDPTETPLTEYMSAIYGDFDEDEYAAQSKEVEELVAACMSDEGFEYVPVDQTQGMGSAEIEEIDYNSEEWVIENGYGMSQSPEQIAESQEQGEEWVDPNQPYVESLSATEQEAYYATLYGEPPAEDELSEDGSYEYNWETAGCQGAADHEVRGEQAFDQEENQPLFDAINAMYEDLQTDPAFAELDAEWASCMADAGYADFSQKPDAMNAVVERSNGLWENAADPETGPTPEEQAEVREYELEVALADFTCSEEVGYTDASLELQFEAERQFIEDHKAELDALVASVEQGE